MGFNIDKQTLDELNILGKFKQGSVYSAFNNVKTRGGEQLLEDMFRHPLNNVDAVNERSAIFQSFEAAQLAFPFEAWQVALMRDYLDTGSGRHRLVAYTDTVVKKILSWATRDERYKKNIQGLQATIAVLNKCFAFVEKVQPLLKGAYSEKLRAIKETLNDKHIDQLRNTDIYSPLSIKSISIYEYQLKSRLLATMEGILDFIYELDVFISVSDIARDKGFVYANALPPEHGSISFGGLYHPCVPRAIGNSVTLTRHSNVLFLTGANMAGKSTLMKSIGIGIYLAHMGFPVAAAFMEFSLRDGMYTSINVSDNISQGYSHFYAEVVRVKQAAEAVASGKRLVLMFDELFKGTNVKDAFDGTLAVTDAFSDYNDCLFIISTHIIELGDALKKRDNIQFAFMPTTMNGSRPQYTYKLQEGISEDRQGMMIIKNEGILELIG